MKSSVAPLRPRRGAEDPGSLSAALKQRVVGQDAVIDAIVPYVELFQAGLAPEGRPAGVFLLLGPTGTGKTHTVEALAEALHGSPRNVLRVDCGEFQMEHEVAKLIGAPPGYLGHRETQPMLSQLKLNAVASERCGLSIVLFDEVEKSAASLTRLLLGVLDKASLKLGDNSAVNFERSLIFLTSNLGAREMFEAAEAGFGFGRFAPREDQGLAGRLHALGMSAVRRRFSPEFVNRIDRVLTYLPLDRASLDAILDLQIEALSRHLAARLGARACSLEFTAAAREFLLAGGTSAASGARELKRTIHRHVLQPLAALMLRQEVGDGGRVRLDCDSQEAAAGLTFAPLRPPRRNFAAEPAA
jgi:ATP-dependent Clp protease ATP-binding subunit ClpA